MSMQVGDKKGAVIADINVTPMADVMIVLLIIFMVITPLLQKGVDVRLPLASNTQERQDKPKQIVVAVKRDSTTYLGTKPLPNPAELTKLVREQLETIPEDQKMVFLKADSELEYAEVMKVMDNLREAGVEEIALIAESQVEGAS